ncbi:hypothetical protein EJB05_17424, partial [Eragrostis curvula]
MRLVRVPLSRLSSLGLSILGLPYEFVLLIALSLQGPCCKTRFPRAHTRHLSSLLFPLRNSARAMAPPCGDAASAATEMPGVVICESAMFPPLHERASGIAAEMGAEDAKNKKPKKDTTPRINKWGLREYSKIVSKKVEAKGRTSYNEVADEIFTELTVMLNGQELDEKNIRRRVYDAFNVLIALRVIAKDKKEIKWMGLSNFRYEKIKTLEKSAESANGIRLPFFLVKASRKARVEIEISEDSKFACFDFNCTPFTLHDDVSILNGIRRNSIRRAGFITHHHH